MQHASLELGQELQRVLRCGVYNDHQHPAAPCTGAPCYTLLLIADSTADQRLTLACQLLKHRRQCCRGRLLHGRWTKLPVRTAIWSGERLMAGTRWRSQ